MTRRRIMHGRRRRKSPLKNIARNAGMMAALSNGAIGGKNDNAADRNKEKPLANQGGDYLTRDEANKMMETRILKGTSQKPKENKLSEGGSEAAEMRKKLNSSAKGRLLGKR